MKNKRKESVMKVSFTQIIASIATIVGLLLAWQANHLLRVQNELVQSQTDLSKTQHKLLLQSLTPRLTPSKLTEDNKKDHLLIQYKNIGADAKNLDYESFTLMSVSCNIESKNLSKITMVHFPVNGTYYNNFPRILAKNESFEMLPKNNHPNREEFMKWKKYSNYSAKKMHEVLFFT